MHRKRTWATATALASIIAFTMLLSTSAGAQEASLPPFATPYLTNESILLLWNTSKGVIAVTGSNVNADIMSFTVNASTPVPLLKTKRLVTLGSLPVVFSINSLTSPRYMAAVLQNGEVFLYSIDDNRTWEYGTAGKATAATFVNNTLIVLESLSSSNVLYAFSPSKLGWYEARLRVGNLLPNRRENINPINLVPVYSLESGSLDVGKKALLVAEVKTGNVSVTASLAGILLRTGANNTLMPLANVTIYVVDPVAGALVGSTTTTSTGSFTAPLPQSFEKIIIYAQINGSCYSFPVSKEAVIKVRHGYYILQSPLIITNTTLPTLCPTEQKPYHLVLIEAGSEPLTLQLIPLNYNLSSTSLNILLAYEENHTLYLLLSTPSQPGARLEVSAINEETMDTIDELRRVYYMQSNPVAAAISPDGRMILVGAADGLLLVLWRTNSTYSLIWSVSVGDAPTHLSVKRVPGTDYYISVAASSNGRLSIFYINPYSGNVKPLTFNNGLLYIDTSYAYTDAAINNGVIMLGSQTGVLALSNTATNVANITVDSLEQYTLTEKSINVIDETGRPLSNFTLTYTEYLTTPEGANITVLNESTIGHDGKAKLRIAPVLTVKLKIIPSDNIHEDAEIALPATELIKKPIVHVNLRTIEVTIRLIDTYSGSAPNASLLINITNNRLNFTKSVVLQPGKGELRLKLKPGNYSAVIRDISGVYYSTVTYRFNVDPNKPLVTFKLSRFDALIRVVLTTSYSPKPNDRLEVSLVSPTGDVLGKTVVEAPLPNLPRRLAFTTKYRGTAVILVKPVAPQGLNPFYRPMRVEAVVNKPRVDVNIQLEPMRYLLRLALVDEKNEPVNATFLIYVFNTTRLVAKAVGETVELRLLRGNYSVKAVPVSNDLPFPLYATVEKKVELIENTSLILVTHTERLLSNVSIVDPYSPNGAIIDEIQLALDGKLVAVFEKNSKPLTTLPILINGSNITVTSKHKIYKKLSRAVKPSNKTITIALQRTIVPVSVYVVNDVSEPIGGATVTFTGINLKYSTSTVTTPDGAADISLPYGKYRVCAAANGYNAACTTIDAVKAVKTTLVVTPQPLTIVMRYSNLIAITAFAIVMIVVIRTYFRKVLERFQTEEEF